MKTIYVPTINDDIEADFDQLFCLWNEAHSYISDHVLKQLLDDTGNNDLDVTFDFSQCGFLRQNAVVFIGGLTRFLQKQKAVVRFALGNNQGKAFSPRKHKRVS